ncbi:MAG TPA: HypC/HybG/HupF family hydrogenase formation chaperone [Conexibacter sp.]|nr:HypC/HybG/HupF family hydrogenase formation chaperone [Conexibacter sp.]
MTATRPTDNLALACHGDHCITCGDEGIPMHVLAIDAKRGLALCTDEDGAHSAVEIALVERVMPGERLLVHAGVALARLEAEEAGAAGSASAARTAEARA